MYEAADSCKDIARAPVTNWEPQCVTLAGYCYAVRHGMKVQLVTPYRVSHLQRHAVTLQVCTHLNSQLGHLRNQIPQKQNCQRKK